MPPLIFPLYTQSKLDGPVQFPRRRSRICAAFVLARRRLGLLQRLQQHCHNLQSSSTTTAASLQGALLFLGRRSRTEGRSQQSRERRRGEAVQTPNGYF